VVKFPHVVKLVTQRVVVESLAEMIVTRLGESRHQWCVMCEIPIEQALPA